MFGWYILQTETFFSKVHVRPPTNNGEENKEEGPVLPHKAGDQDQQRVPHDEEAFTGGTLVLGTVGLWDLRGGVCILTDFNRFTSRFSFVALFRSQDLRISVRL